MVDEQQIAIFFELFRGNPKAHYVRDVTGKYQAVARGLTLEDVARHLRGDMPSILSIPVDATGRSHFGVLDVDRHEDTDAPVDHAGIARQITERNLPLVCFQSKNGKGAWLVLFLRETNGISAATVRALLTRYQQVLEISGKVEIFPKNETLTPGQKGSGVNLGYFGSERPAYGRAGEELDLTGFLTLAQARRVLGQPLADRDLILPPPITAQLLESNRALSEVDIRNIYVRNLEAIQKARPGQRNTILNTATFFAARAYAAGALAEIDEEIKRQLAAAALSVHVPVAEIEATIRSAWTTGSARPLQVLNKQQAHDAALERINGLINDVNLPVQDLEAMVRDAALLTPLEYGSLRRFLAKRIGLMATMLDAEVAKRRSEPQVEMQGADVVLEDVTPWSAPVDGAALLERLSAVFDRYIIFTHRADIFTLATWSIFTYACDNFQIAPYIGITSPEKECGKTSLVEILACLVNRPIFASNFTPAAIFRAVDLYHPTLLVDELDTFLDRSAELTGILNSGHKKAGAHVFRVVGENQTLRKFNTWGPKVYGMIGSPAPTLDSRSIRIRLTRKKADEKIEKLPRKIPGEFEQLRRQAARWVQDHTKDLKEHQADVAGLTNREADNWEPLLTIAELAGNAWPERLRTALTIPRPSEEDGIRVQLLRDVRNIFYTRNARRLPIELLLLDLLRQKESPWHDMTGAQNQELNQYHLKNLLASFGIKSRAVRIDKQLQLLLSGARKEVTRGYDLDDFADAVTRYLKDSEPQTVEISRGNETLI